MEKSLTQKLDHLKDVVAVNGNCGKLFNANCYECKLFLYCKNSSTYLNVNENRVISAKNILKNYQDKLKTWKNLK